MLLLDAHALLWQFVDPLRLREATRDLLLDRRHPTYVSAATVWELEIKQAIGKLRIPGDLLADLAEAGFEVLPVNGDHAVRAARLPHIHRDPFDRMLVAQAQIERLTVVTDDADVARYDVKTLPATDRG